MSNDSVICFATILQIKDGFREVWVSKKETGRMRAWVFDLLKVFVQLSYFDQRKTDHSHIVPFCSVNNPHRTTDRMTCIEQQLLNWEKLQFIGSVATYLCLTASHRKRNIKWTKRWFLWNIWSMGSEASVYNFCDKGLICARISSLHISFEKWKQP